jgi:hypothetical protein
MKKILIAATLIAGFAAPALAMGPFYVMFDNTTKKCSIVKAPPTDTAKFAMMGEYGSEADAHMAMKGMMSCK